MITKLLYLIIIIYRVVIAGNSQNLVLISLATRIYSKKPFLLYIAQHGLFAFIFEKGKRHTSLWHVWDVLFLKRNHSFSSKTTTNSHFVTIFAQKRTRRYCTKRSKLNGKVLNTYIIYNSVKPDRENFVLLERKVYDRTRELFRLLAHLSMRL